MPNRRKNGAWKSERRGEGGGQTQRLLQNFVFCACPNTLHLGTDGRKAKCLTRSSLSSFNTKLSQTMPRKQLKHVTQENFQELKWVNQKNNRQCKNKIRSFYIILTFFPVGTDPVNETLSTSGCDESKWPVLAPP